MCFLHHEARSHIRLIEIEKVVLYELEKVVLYEFEKVVLKGNLSYSCQHWVINPSTELTH